MGARIYEFPLAVTDSQFIDAPYVGQVLTVGVQRGIPCLWAVVWPDEPGYGIDVRTFGTGHPIDISLQDYSYVGTYQLNDGALIFHVFCRQRIG